MYLELIAFTHPVEYYPEGSEERRRRESSPWASKLPGLIDYAFLGTSSTTSKIINSRAQEEGSGVRYLAEVPGGRETSAGKVLQWLITGPDPISNVEGIAKNGSLPFFCGDITPREWRVRNTVCSDRRFKLQVPRVLMVEGVSRFRPSTLNIPTVLRKSRISPF